MFRFALTCIIAFTTAVTINTQVPDDLMNSQIDFGGINVNKILGCKTEADAACSQQNLCKNEWNKPRCFHIKKDQLQPYFDCNSAAFDTCMAN